MRFRIWVFIAISIFGVGLVLGLTLPGNTADFLTEELAAVKQLGNILGPFTVSTTVFILLKNISTLLLSFIFSPLLCLLPILALVVNGGLLSFVSAAIIKEKSLGLLIVGLLPHGIFELPAVIIGEAAALSFGTMVVIALVSKERRKLLLPNLKQNAWYLVVACILFVPAAIIETYVTPLFLT